MKIAYVGFDILIGALKYIVGSGHDVVKIFTCNCDNVTEFNVGIISIAKNNKIPYTTEQITEKDLKELKSAGCDLLICAGYYYKIPTPDNYEDSYFPMINVHPCPVPKYRGVWPMPVMLLNKEKTGAVAVMKIAKEFDTGDIICQNYFDIPEKATLDEYMRISERVMEKSLDYVLNNLKECLNNSTPQGDGIYIENPTEKDWTVRSDMTVEEADAVLRAFYGYECIYSDGVDEVTIINGRAVREKDKGEVSATPYRLVDGYIILNGDR